MCDTEQLEAGNNKETKDDSNIEEKEIWKESLLLDSSGNLLDPEKVDMEGDEGKKEGDQSPPGVKPDLQYSRAELYDIQKLPSSQIKPDFLDAYPIQARFSFVRGVWERESGVGGGPPNLSQPPPTRSGERWPRAVTPNEAHDGYNDSKQMRRGDNRLSRGKDTSDPGLILSPQRRSFNSGCYITGGGSLMNAREVKTLDRENMRGSGGGGGNNDTRRFGGTGRVLPWAGQDGIGGPGETTFVAPNLMPDYTQRGGGAGGGGSAQPQGGGGMGGMFERRYADVKRPNNRNSGDYNNRNNGDYHRNDYSRNNGDFSRNSGGDYNSGGGRYNGMNGNDRRRNNSDRNHGSDFWEEPEWFSEGPTSQNDVIELRGFHDEEKEGHSPDKGRKSSSSDNERVHRKSSSSSGGGLGDVGAQDHSEPRPRSRAEESVPLKDGLKFGPGSGEPNIDDLLSNLDTFPGLLTNGTESSGADPTSGGGSRFSRWFRKESPGPPQSPSPHHMINDLINDITDENRPPNANGAHNRFSPVSPAFGTQHQGGGQHRSTAGSNFLDMMLKQQQDGGGVLRSGSIRDLEGVGKLHSVEELEAKIRHSNMSHPHHGHNVNKEEDMANFKKLLAKSIDAKKPVPDATAPLVSNVGTSALAPEYHETSPGPDPAILPQMMTKLLQQQHHLAQNLHQQAGHPGAANVGVAPAPWGNLLAAQNSSNYHELVQKIVKIQQAQEYQRRMAALGLAPNPPSAGFHPPNHHTGSSPLPPELQHHLLNNPQFDARNLIRHPPYSGPPEDFLCSLPREILVAYAIEALLAQQASPGGGPLSPNASSQGVAPPHPMQSPGGPNFLQPGPQSMGPGGPAAQQYMMGPQGPSPANNSVFQQQQQRIPSPTQLAAHSQSILQNAILKKKIEEQKETLRKRVELLQRAVSPSSTAIHPHPMAGGMHAHPPGHELRTSTSSPVINAFTPTSVLRKMTAAGPTSETVSQQEKDMLMNQSQGVPWSQLSNRSQQGVKNNVMNLGNQQIAGPGGVLPGHPNPAGLLHSQPGNAKPRSKFTMSSKLQSSKSSGHLAPSLAEQMNMLPQDPGHGNPFTSHHSQAAHRGGSLVSEQLEKWFSPEFLARAAQQPPPPSHHLLSVQELESHAPPTAQGGPPSAAGAVQN